MKIPLQILLLLICNLLFGQRQNTRNLFYNISIDSKPDEIQIALLADTSNFDSKMVGTWRNKSHVKVPYFYSKTNAPFFNTEPELIHIKIDSTQKTLDSTLTIELTLYVNFNKNVKRKEVKALYKKTVEFLKTEYDSLSTKYLQGLVRQETQKSGKQNYKRWTVDEYSTLLYNKIGDKKQKLTISWFDERKHQQTLFISYRLNH